MNRKYDLAIGRSESHQNRLNKLAERFTSLELELSQLEAKIEAELPKLGLAVSPLGNRRSGTPASGTPASVILASGHDTSGSAEDLRPSLDTDSSTDLDAAASEPIYARKTGRRPRPR